MPRRKQPRLLRRTGPSGEQLGRSRQRVSFGVDRQELRSKQQLLEEVDPVRLAEADLAEQWYSWFRSDLDERYREDLRHQERSLGGLQVLLGELTTQRTLLDALPESVRAAWRPEADPVEDAAIDREGLEWRIVHPWGEAGITDRSQLLDAVGDSRNVSLINQALLRCDQPYAAENIFNFAPLWIRSPETFVGSSLSDLLNHLFVRYPVPPCLYRAWARNGPGVDPDSKWLRWFLVYAQGGSLKQAAAIDYGWTVSRRFQHFFALAPAHLSPLLATQYAEFERLGLAEGTRRLLWTDRRLMFDLSAHWRVNDQRRLEHWVDFAAWLDRWYETIAPLDVARLLDWAEHERIQDPDFRWAGRSATVALARAQAYREEQQARRYGYLSQRSWPAHDMDWEGPAEHPGLWQIRELTNGFELAEEGERLRHCVGGYGYRCLDGVCAIFSLRRLGQCCLTIELDLATGTIRQALGRSNRAATAAEQVLLQRWLEAVVQPRFAAARRDA